MRIGIDFDRVLFQTDRFKEDLTKEFPRFGETYDQAKKDDFYNMKKHAEIMDVEIEELLKEIRKCSEYVYSDVDVLDRLGEEHEIIIVTRGDPVIQREKLENSGVLEHVDGYQIVTDRAKDVADIEFLIDDWEKELEKAGLPGIILDREKDELRKILDYVETPDFEQVFRRYDIRGRYPSELNENFAYRLGRTMAEFAQKQGIENIVVTKDPKESSENLKKSFILGAKKQGIGIIDCRTGSTDYTAFSAVKENAIGIQVTSSHMPLDFNGFKLIYPKGNGFMNPDLDRIKKIFRENSFSETVEKRGVERKDYRQDYLEKAGKFYSKYLEKTDARIVLDNLGGKGSSLAPELLERIGAEVDNITGETPSIDPPDPKPGNLGHVEDRVEETGADIGLATDMDSDRLAVYYNGEWLSGDEIFAILIEIMKPGKVVSSIDATRIVEDTAQKYGGVEYTRVGDPFVIDKTLEISAELSGEPNGHYCFTDFVPYNSGALAAAMIAGADLEGITGNILEITVERESIEVEDKQKSMEKVKQKIKSEHTILSEIDGIKFELDSGRVLIRSSGSSEKLRIVAEAATKGEAEKACKKAGEIVRNT